MKAKLKMNDLLFLFLLKFTSYNQLSQLVGVVSPRLVGCTRSVLLYLFLKYVLKKQHLYNLNQVLFDCIFFYVDGA